MLGWSQMEKTDRFGVWFFRGARQGGNLFSSLYVAGDWERKGRTTQRGRSPVIPHALVNMRTGVAPLSGHTLESCAGHC